MKKSAEGKLLIERGGCTGIYSAVGWYSLYELFGEFINEKVKITVEVIK